MDREEFQKKYDNSILVCCTENSINKVFYICDLMDLTVSKSKQITAILIGEQTAKSPLFHVEQFLNDFYNEMQGRGEKETKMFEQRMNNAIYKLKQKYGCTHIIKGTDMGTVIQFIQELNMEVVQEEMDDVIYIKGERCDKPYIKNSTRQFIADLMSNMIDVLNPFINKETMVEIKESCNAEYLINEAEFYITSTFTTPLQKEYDKQRKVLSIGFGNKKIMVDEEDFHVFLKAFYYLYKCNEWIKKDNEKNKEQPKEPVFNKGNKIMYTIKDSNSNTYPVRRLSERVYESKEHKTLFITDEEGTVTGIYKEK